MAKFSQLYKLLCFWKKHILYSIFLIVHSLSSEEHMNRVIFYNNECIQLDYLLVHLLMQRGGDKLKCKITKAGRFSTIVVITRGLSL